MCMDKKKKKQDERNINVIVPIETYEGMSEYAEEVGYSLSDAVRFALKEFIKGLGSKKK